MNRCPSALPSEPPAISLPQQCSYPVSSHVQTFAFSWLLLPLHVLLHPTSPPQDAHGVPCLLCGPPESLPVTCIFLAIPSMDVALAAWELRAPGSSEASPLSLAETGPDCHRGLVCKWQSSASPDSLYSVAF